MRPVELEPRSKGKREPKSEYEKTREYHIRQNMWKASYMARKVASFSGVPFDELRSVALEAMVKLYDKWDPSKANFSTWLNRSLMFQILNYLRDHSRMVKIPRSYADAYLKMRKIIAQNPEITDEKVSEMLDIKLRIVTETRQAYQMSYMEIDEETDMPFDEIVIDEDNLTSMFGSYEWVLEKLSDLPEEDYNFLTDVHVKKLSNTTIGKKYKGLNNTESIARKTSEILSGILRESNVEAVLGSV